LVVRKSDFDEKSDGVDCGFVKLDGCSNIDLLLAESSGVDKNG
jgi:hypothetical protein